MKENIIDIKLIQLPLSSGKLTIGAAVQTESGIIEWDASPMGITTGAYDPSNLDFLSAINMLDTLKMHLILLC